MIIGFTGPSGARKTAAAKRLAAAWGFERIHAGEPIKAAVRQGYGLSRRQLRGKAKDRPAAQLGGATPRDLLEATGLGTHLSAPGTTAIALHKRLMQHVAKGNSVAIDGVRDEMEAAVIRGMGGMIWRMDSGKPPNPRFPMDKRQVSLGADATIDSSSGSKSDIHQAVDRQMMTFMRAYAALSKPAAKAQE
jgi:hypothetical protein